MLAGFARHLWYKLPNLSTSLWSTPPSATAALARAQLQELMATYCADECRASTRACHDAATAQFWAAMERLETQQLPGADYNAPRSLEALRLEDPAAMSGCWNPGYAARASQ